MNWKKFALVAALSGTTIGAVGCGGGDEPGEPVTVAYVVSTADLPSPTGDGVVVGFNLDDVVSPAGGTECNEVEDYVSPTNGEGVDNQFHGVGSLLAGMLDEGIPGAIQEQVAAGSFLLVMEVSDVNNFMNDTNVSVHLFLGQSDAAIEIGAGGLIAPDQAFTTEQEIGTVPGSITNGRLVVSGVDLPLRLEVDGNMVELTLQDASVSASVSPTGLSNGEIGAYLLVDDIIAIATMFGLSADRALIESVAPPDIGAGAAAGMCDGVSIGLSFQAVAAQTPATMSM